MHVSDAFQVPRSIRHRRRVGNSAMMTLSTELQAALAAAEIRPFWKWGMRGR
jgi:hypothetical protein